MKRIEKLKANRLAVLKVLAKGGRVEKRRVYPFPETFHLVRLENAGTYDTHPITSMEAA